MDPVKVAQPFSPSSLHVSSSSSSAFGPRVRLPLCRAHGRLLLGVVTAVLPLVDKVLALVDLVVALTHWERERGVMRDEGANHGERVSARGPGPSMEGVVVMGSQNSV